MTMSQTDEDAVLACTHLAERSGATQFEIGHLHDDVPVHEAAWYAVAHFRGARLTAENHTSPAAAAMALATRLLSGATCRCGKPVTLGGSGGCPWRLAGQRWEPGCDAPPIRVQGQRGDVEAMNRAMRRASRKAGR
jgi:hypothetical protein